MEEFLGILFAGGRGKRLGQITRFISKAFLPVFDRPVFMYPLAQLEASKYISNIIILTNKENNDKLNNLGYRTVVQDDNQVNDMFSGLRYIKRIIKADNNYVLMPCDNVSDIVVDRSIEYFSKNDVDICFNVTQLRDRSKLTEMGVLDPKTGQMVYKPHEPPSEWGVIAPYVARHSFDIPENGDDEVINHARTSYIKHTGYWFDIGDVKSLQECSAYIAKRTS